MPSVLIIGAGPTGVPVANSVAEKKHGVSGQSILPSAACSRSCQPSFRAFPAAFAAEAFSSSKWWPSDTRCLCSGANTLAGSGSVLGTGFSGFGYTDSGRNALRSWCW